MSRQSVSVQHQPVHLRIEADVDQGVTSRLLDLLGTHDCFPRTLRLDRQRDSLVLELEIDDASREALLARRMRQIAGVRRVLPLVDSR